MATVANAMSEENKPLAERISSFPARVREYVGELRGEMQRVTWPAWRQVRATTAVVIIAVFAFAAYFAVVDIVMSRLIQRIFALFVG
jgi:preprotein translocase subunit SecE